MIKKAKKTTVVTKTKAKKTVKSVNPVKKPVGKAFSVKKSIKKAAAIKQPVETAAVKKPLGKVTHFYDQISVAVVALNSALKVDDRIKIGREERFLEQAVKSMQMDHQNIQIAKKGQEIGLKVRKRVRENDLGLNPK